MEGNDKNYQNYQKGKLKIKQYKYKQALTYLKDAHQFYKHNRNSDATYIYVLVSLGNAYQGLSQYGRSKSFYEQALSQCLNFENNAQNFNSYYKRGIIEEKYNALTSLSLLQGDMAQRIEDKYENWAEFKQLINDSFQYLKKSHQIVVMRLKKIITKYIYKQQGFTVNWGQQYIKVILNIANTILIQAQQFKDKKLFKMIISLIKRAQNFYKLSEIKLKLKNIISKVYYIKGVCFMKLEEYDNAKIYLQKDYKYCQNNKNQEDFKKTRQQLVKLCILTKNFSDASKYALKNKQLKQFIEQKKNTYNKIHKKIQSLLNKIQPINYVIIQQITYLIQDYDFGNFFYEQLFKVLKKQLQSLNLSNDQKYQLNYYAANVQFCYKKYKEAYYYIKQCQRYVSRNTTQQLRFLILKSIINSQIEDNTQIAKKLYQQCITKAQQLDEKKLLEQAKQNFFQYQIEIDRQDRDKYFLLPDDSWLFELVKGDKLQQQNIDSSITYSRHLNSECYKKELGKKYNQICDSLQISKNQLIQLQIENCIQNKKFPFQYFVNLTEIEINTIIQIVPNLTKLDLRNHHISKIVSSSMVKKIKYVSEIGIGNNLSENILFQIFQQLIAVKVIKMCCVPSLNSIKNKYPFESLKSPKQLKVISLKACSLRDRSILFMKMQQFENLQNLSIADNQINGSCLVVLKGIKSLQTLNLSGNPLQQYSQILQLKELKFKRMKKQLTQEIIKNNFLNNLTVLKIINFSNNSSSYIQKIFENICTKCTQNQITLSSIQQIFIDSIMLSGQILTLIGRLFFITQNLKKLYFKECGIQKKQFYYFQKKIQKLRESNHLRANIEFNNIIETDLMMDCE